MAVDKLFDRWTFFGSGGPKKERCEKRQAQDKRNYRGESFVSIIATVQKTLLICIKYCYTKETA